MIRIHERLPQSPNGGLWRSAVDRGDRVDDAEVGSFSDVGVFNYVSHKWACKRDQGEVIEEIL